MIYFYNSFDISKKYRIFVFIFKIKYMNEKQKERANNVCVVNNIDIKRLKSYSDKNLLVKYVSPSGEYDVRYEFSIYSLNNNSLTIKYKEYCLRYTSCDLMIFICFYVLSCLI